MPRTNRMILPTIHFPSEDIVPRESDAGMRDLLCNRHDRVASTRDRYPPNAARDARFGSTTAGRGFFSGITSQERLPPYLARGSFLLRETWQGPC